MIEAAIKRRNCLIISEDQIFMQLFKRILHQKCHSVNIVYIESFIELLEHEGSLEADMVLLDDTISGAAHHEVIDYLRSEKQIMAPLYYFSQSDYLEKQAYSSGASYFFRNPIDPVQVVDHIMDRMKSN